MESPLPPFLFCPSLRQQQRTRENRDDVNLLSETFFFRKAAQILPFSSLGRKHSCKQNNQKKCLEKVTEQDLYKFQKIVKNKCCWSIQTSSNSPNMPYNNRGYNNDRRDNYRRDDVSDSIRYQFLVFKETCQLLRIEHRFVLSQILSYSKDTLDLREKYRAPSILYQNHILTRCQGELRILK